MNINLNPKIFINTELRALNPNFIRGAYFQEGKIKETNEKVIVLTFLSSTPLNGSLVIDKNVESVFKFNESVASIKFNTIEEGRKWIQYNIPEYLYAIDEKKYVNLNLVEYISILYIKNSIHIGFFFNNIEKCILNKNEKGEGYYFHTIPNVILTSPFNNFDEAIAFGKNFGIDDMDTIKKNIQ